MRQLRQSSSTCAPLCVCVCSGYVCRGRDAVKENHEYINLADSSGDITPGNCTFEQ